MMDHLQAATSRIADSPSRRLAQRLAFDEIVEQRAAHPLKLPHEGECLGAHAGVGIGAERLVQPVDILRNMAQRSMQAGVSSAWNWVARSVPPPP